MAPDDLLEHEWLDQYLAGEGASDERERWRQQIVGDPTLVALVASVERATGAAPRARRVWNVDDAWSAVGARRRHHIRSAAASLHRRVWRSTRVLSVGTAAVALAVAVALVYRTSLVSAPKGQVYATAFGERAKIRLPDGTQLTLAPGSRLRLAADYGRRGREVTLNGEAYFSVLHDAMHPFAVHVGHATVTDVGTEFDVRSYLGDDAIRVAVVEGEVMASLGRGRIGAPSLRGGDMADLTDTSMTVIHDADVAAVTAWTQGGLTFNKTPLRDVVRDISRTFGVVVTVEDSTLLDRRITATLSGESLDVVLDVVTHVVGARFEQTAHGVVIRNGMASAKMRQDAPRIPLTTARAGDLRQ